MCQLTIHRSNGVISSEKAHYRWWASNIFWQIPKGIFCTWVAIAQTPTHPRTAAFCNQSYFMSNKQLVALTGLFTAKQVDILEISATGVQVRSLNGRFSRVKHGTGTLLWKTQFDRHMCFTSPTNGLRVRGNWAYTFDDPLERASTIVFLVIFDVQM